MLNTMRTFKALSVAALLILAQPLLAATPGAAPEELGLSTERLERIDALVQRNIETGSFTGAVTLVARDGRIAHHKAHGLMDLATNKRMVDDGIFRIMSMTKPVIAVATLMMLEEGAVRLQDPVSRFIPEWQDMVVGVPIETPTAAASGPSEPQYDMVPAQRPVQVRDLLTHTSGVVSGPISNFATRAVAAGPEETLADYIPRLGQVPLEFQPGTRWGYSAAAGFDVLSRIVEVTSGMPIDRFLEERLFGPLGMKDTTYIPPHDDPRLVTRYTRTQQGLEPAGEMPFMNGIYFSGGGGLFSTAPDYARFALMLANGGELDGVRVLSPRTVELMASVFAPDTMPGRPEGEPHGLGVRVVTDPAARNTLLSEGSFGWSGAFGTHFWVDPKEKLVAVVMTQTANMEFLRDFENMVMQAIVDSAR